MTMTSADMAPAGSGRPERRTFTHEYKLQIVSEYDAATEHGQRDALLRREGLYASHIRYRRASQVVFAKNCALTGCAETQR